MSALTDRHVDHVAPVLVALPSPLRYDVVQGKIPSILQRRRKHTTKAKSATRIQWVGGRILVLDDHDIGSGRRTEIHTACHAHGTSTVSFGMVIGHVFRRHRVFWQSEGRKGQAVRDGVVAEALSGSEFL